jgi:hypothetical protein
MARHSLCWDEYRIEISGKRVKSNREMPSMSGIGSIEEGAGL